MKVTKSLGFSWWQIGLIVVLHIGLLAWILFVLANAGLMETTRVMLHFLGISLSGAFLIRACAWIAYDRHKKGK